MGFPLGDVKTGRSKSILSDFIENNSDRSLDVSVIVLALLVLLAFLIPLLKLSPIQTVEQSSLRCLQRKQIASPVLQPVPNKNST